MTCDPALNIPAHIFRYRYAFIEKKACSQGDYYFIFPLCWNLWGKGSILNPAPGLMLLWKLEPILNSHSWSINSCKLEFIMEAAWYLTETAQTKLHLDTIKQRAQQTTLHCAFINFLFPALESLPVMPAFYLTSLQPFCLIFASHWMWYFTASTDVLWRDT